MPESQASLERLFSRLYVLMIEGTTGNELTELCAFIRAAAAKEPDEQTRNQAEVETCLALAMGQIWEDNGVADAIDSARGVLVHAKADKPHYVWSVALLAELHRRAGDLPAAEHQIEHLRTIAAEPSTIGLLELVAGRLSLTRGQIAEAHRRFKAASRAARDADATLYGFALCHFIFTSSAMAEDTGGALDDLVDLCSTKARHQAIQKCLGIFIRPAEQVGQNASPEQVAYADGVADAISIFQIMRI